MVNDIPFVKYISSRCHFECSLSLGTSLHTYLGNVYLLEFRIDLVHNALGTRLDLVSSDKKFQVAASTIWV